MAAENYHLKWDCHLSYLNSSVATLYKNEKFADVVLYSSASPSGNAVDSGCGITMGGISAHKFILSSCSQFFATMFETTPIPAPNGVLYVVLPPDLSHRAVQILVQYMYSGEATVSNDILSEVLRGGEILKIRGLCRSTSSHPHHQSGTSSGSAHYSTNGTRPMAPITHTQLPSAHSSDIYASKCPSGGNNCSTRYVIEHPNQFRGLGASVMPKESPVIVKSPKMSSQMGLLPGNKHQSGGISVNKEVAIDPSIGSASICSEVGCSSCPLSAEQRRHRSSQSDEHDHMERDYAEQAPPPDEREEVSMGYERNLRRASGNERVREYFVPEQQYDQLPNTNNSKQYMEPEGSTLQSRLASPPHPQNFLAIKQEPTDWSALSPTENSGNINRPSSPMSPKQPLDFKMPLGGAAAVKLETTSVHSADEDEQHASDYDNFTRLVCEVCKKSFDDPKTWVRHLETHASMVSSQTAASTTSISETAASNGDLAKSYVPKKRRRVSQQENGMDHVTLLCDLCSTSFETPAEWVRHMNNQHTEIELAMFNSKKGSEQKTNTSTSANTGATATSSSHNQPNQTHKKYFPNRPSLTGYPVVSDHSTDRTFKRSHASNGTTHHSNASSSLSTPNELNSTSIADTQA